MTVKTVEAVITRFLKSELPEVLALNGAWGVGKTFAWNQILTKHKDDIKLEKYSYVSLFGMSSIAELRTAIYAKSNAVRFIGERPSAEVINKEWWEFTKQGWRWVSQRASILKDLPYMKTISTTLETLAPYLTRDTIVCLDDFERLSPDRIKADELLGLISELKEEKGCKVVLIFNESELHDTGDYKKYREKVIDIELTFAPTADEATDLALPPDLPNRETIKKYVLLLNIKNIRILKKIVSLTKIMNVELAGLHNLVMEQAAMTLVLLVWCHYDSTDKKPPLDFVIKWSRVSWHLRDKKEKETVEQKTLWATTLQNYGFEKFDEFDLSIHKFIEQGFLEETGLSDEARKLDSTFRANDIDQSFTTAWRMFHDTFSDNKNELIPALIEGVQKAVKRLSPSSLHSTVRLLRECGEDDKANDLIEYYLQARSDENKIFNLVGGPFSSDFTDAIFIERFAAKYTESQITVPLLDAARHISGGPSRDDIAALTKASENDFIELFKLEHGTQHHSLVSSCVDLINWGDYKSIGETARAALIRIGRENHLNAMRVKRFGVDDDELNDNKPAAKQ